MKAGNLRQRANGKWQYRKPYGSYPDGRRRERSAVFTAKNQTEASRIATQLAARWDREHEAQADYRDTMNELVDTWLANVEHSPTTAYRNRAVIAAIRAEFGTTKLVNITPLAINQWKLKLAKPYRKEGDKRDSQRLITRGPSTIRQYLAWLHTILEEGYRWEMIPTNPADKVKPPKVRQVDQAVHMPTVQALAVILSYCTNPNLVLAAQIAASTGCRAGEIAALRWADVRDGVLYVSESSYKVPGEALGRKGTKANKKKRLLLTDDLLAALEAHRAWQVEQCANAGETAVQGPILANLRDDLTASRGYPPGWMGQEWSRLCKSLGTPPYKFHGLRHLHGSIMLAKGISPTDAADRQGQDVNTLLAFYAHAFSDAAQKAANVIGAEMSPLFALPQGGEHEQAR